jgi:hypothetical protein
LSSPATAVTPESFEEAVTKFVRDLGRPGPVNQISRWGEPVCPTTEGLSPGFNDFVSERIREVAARVGAPGPGDCAGGANVSVMFTTKPDRLMTHVRKHHAGLLGFHHIGERKSLAAFQPPMKSWYVTMTTVPGQFASIDHAYGPGVPGGTGSRIRLPYKSRFALVLVVVDADLIEGQAIGPVADKIAMLVLSRPAPRGGCSSLPSILDFLEPACPSGEAAQSLTAYDEAYLKALYAFDRDELKGYMRDTVRDYITENAGPSAAVPLAE